MSEREMQALGSIEDGLAFSDPALASMLGTFSRLTSGEEMPARDKIRVRPRAVHSPRRAWRPDYSTALLLVWVVVSAALIAVALALNAGGHEACTPIGGLAPQPSRSVRSW
jgi:hypothetical protein